MHSLISIALMTCACALAGAAVDDVSIRPRGERGEAKSGAPDVRIGLSPAGERRAERQRQMDLYRHSVAGDLDARREWSAIATPLRTSLLAELAITRDRDSADNTARRRCLYELATLPPSSDPDGIGLVALARTAVADGSFTLRDLACRGLAARGDNRIPALLACALRNDDPLFRANAQAALKAIGGPRVFEVVIEHWKEIWGASSRNHIFVGQVRSYIGDYDISGDSYDPVVRSFFTGAVLDARVLKVESDIYIVTLREISGADPAPGNTVAAWEKWLQNERPKLAQDEKKKREKALASLQGNDDE